MVIYSLDYDCSRSMVEHSLFSVCSLCKCLDEDLGMRKDAVKKEQNLALFSQLLM